VTAGGRLLTVAALGTGAADARARAYRAAAQIRIEGAQMRRDIAAGEVG
jgi:phosphoribosylamine--glycine ligase